MKRTREKSDQSNGLTWDLIVDMEDVCLRKRRKMPPRDERLLNAQVKHLNVHEKKRFQSEVISDSDDDFRREYFTNDPSDTNCDSPIMKSFHTPERKRMPQSMQHSERKSSTRSNLSKSMEYNASGSESYQVSTSRSISQSRDSSSLDLRIKVKKKSSHHKREKPKVVKRKEIKRIGRGSFRSGMRMDDEGDDFDMQSGKERTYRRATNSDIDWIYQTKYYQGEQEDVVRDLNDSLSNDEQKQIHKIFLRYNEDYISFWKRNKDAGVPSISLKKASEVCDCPHTALKQKSGITVQPRAYFFTLKNGNEHISKHFCAARLDDRLNPKRWDEKINLKNERRTFSRSYCNLKRTKKKRQPQN